MPKCLHGYRMILLTVLVIPVLWIRLALISRVTLYVHVCVRHLYAEYEEQSYQNIGKLTNEHSDVLPAPELRDRIYKEKNTNFLKIIMITIIKHYDINIFIPLTIYKLILYSKHD